jgi:hypothetical protein
MLKTAGDKLFIAGLTDIKDGEALLAKIKELAPGSPVDIAFNQGGRIEVGGVKLPVPFVQLKSLRILPVSCRVGDEWHEGLAIHLPKYLSRVQLAHEKILVGTPYRMDILVEQFYQDLFAEITKEIQENLLVVRLPGLQGQAAPDIRLKHGEVGISSRRAATLKEELERIDASLKDRENIDGLMVIGKRFPAASPTGARWVILRVLDDGDDNKIYVNPTAMNYLHGGDFDGDLYYVMTKGPFHTLKVEPVGPPLPMEVYHRHEGCMVQTLVAGFTDSTEEEAVNRVMGACIKELTGLLTYTFLNLARGYAVKLGDFKRAYNEVLVVFEPLIEAVMDARKKEGSVQSLFLLADALQKFSQSKKEN